MTPAARRLINAATQPLGDKHELRRQAENELENAMAETGATEGEVEEMAVKLETRRKKMPGWAATACAGIAVVVSGFLVAKPVVAYVRTVKSVSSGFLDIPMIELRETEKLTPKQRLLFENYDSSGSGTRYEKLWRSEPGNPVYLAEYVKSRYGVPLTEELREAAAKNDPNNGFFDLMDAAGLTKSAIELEISSKWPARWKVKDEAKFAEALAKIRIGLGRPEFRTYQREIFREREALTREADDVIGGMARTSRLMFSTSSGSISLRKVCDVWNATAQRCVEKRDMAGFREIISDWENLTVKMIGEGNTLVDLLVARVMLSGLDFRFHAKELGLNEEAKRFEDLYDRLEREKKARKNPAWSERVAHRSSTLAGMSTPMLARQVDNPREPEEAEIKPGRLAEHAFVERIFSAAGWLLLCVAAGAGALALRLRGKLAKGLSESVAGLLRTKDRAMIFMIGIGIPLLWYFLITRFTPLGAREFSPSHVASIPTGGQFAALGVSLVILLVVIGGWLLGKRGKALGLAGRRQWIGWLAAVMALACVPLFGAVNYALENWMIFTLCGVFAVPVLWVLAGPVWFFIGNRGQVLRRSILARVVWPVWLAAAAVVSLLTLAMHVEERFWTKRDVLFSVPADSQSSTAYENEITEILRGELREILADFKAAR
ncbi:MAG: hypothetical protein V4733_10825 [Verrucomicrobiota bacterium]